MKPPWIRVDLLLTRKGKFEYSHIREKPTGGCGRDRGAAATSQQRPRTARCHQELREEKGLFPRIFRGNMVPPTP